MKHFLILLTTVIFTYTFTIAQSTPEDSVKAAVNKLFEGMKSADPGLINNAFADSAILQTIARNQSGQTIIRTDKVSDFAEQIAKLPKGAADERITFETVRIDGPLAIVWTPYKFYYNGNFSHCGVNSFQLVRINGTWKIQYLIDTRRRQECQ
ncbi:MAG TPA: nuclear transport factor 2 family protein [Chitinophagaceae bacterium]|nr:nuclear transport factor 2 family protein [Chitinophagaceae bacterium]